MSEQKYVTWNPWHGCTKYSEGCRYCYVYRQDEAYGSSVSSEQCRKTQNFNLPVKKKRDGSFKVEPGSIVMTCFTSDFLLKDADEWREECGEMIKSRSDCMFYFFTKRIERFMECVPADWGEGYSNVIVGCTCENQDRADFRLPIFTELPIKHKTVIIGPMLGPIELEKYLNDNGIMTVKHYPTPMHLQGAYKDLGIPKGALPVAEEISSTVLSLPMFYGMTEAQTEYVIDKVNSFC